MRTVLICATLAAMQALPLAAQTLPDFAAADFSTPRGNPLMPLAPDTPARTIAGSFVDDDGETVVERSVLRVLGPGPMIAGVASVTVMDEAYEGDLLVERTFDHYAADAAGNVWYLGEDVLNFRHDDDGVLVSTDAVSAWRAGVNDARPGIAMPADLALNVPLFQEHAPADAAMDWAEVVAVGLTVTTPAGTFTDVVQFYEASTVEPDLREFKFYAPGIGMIRAEEELSEARDNPAVVVELQP